MLASRHPGGFGAEFEVGFTNHINLNIHVLAPLLETLIRPQLRNALTQC